MKPLSKQTLVSVVMPAFNSEATIGESIKSVLKQSFQGWELIVVDDGSTDGTAEVVNSFSDERIQLIIQVNSGVSSARNAAITRSSGQYIAFLDSDDIWHPEKLRKQLDFFKKHPEIGLLYTDKMCFYESLDNAFFCEYKIDVGIDDDYQRLLTHDYISTLTVMTRKDVLEHVGVFKSDLRCAEDWDLWIRIAKNFSVSVIREPLAYYREHPGGISKNVADQLKGEWAVIESNVLNSCVEREVKKISLWVWHKKAARSKLGELDYLGFTRHFSKMLVLDFCRTVSIIFKVKDRCG